MTILDDDLAWEVEVLHVDGTNSTWPISDAVTSSAMGLILWTGADLDWSSATTVTARLRTADNS
ncbi:hypothetical protein [Candidatus Poriferisodalis sp.]|uniref:hypothetical protein n=1 Tax=Candidatus Poriferisodalis sp. TaxID=3101277 RepID=UPI003B5C6B83